MFFCGVDTTVNVFGNTIAPELAELGKDPVPPDFTTAYKVVVSSLDIGSQLWQGSFDATHCAEAYLNGVNRSYDRYVAANAANDLVSVDLQFSSIRAYLAKFSLCAQEASMELRGIGAQISGYSWNSGGIDATAFDLAKDYIHQNGINAEQEAFFRSLGLDESDFAFAISSVLSLDALQFQQPFSKLLNEAANEFSSIASAAAPQSTPEPGSMSLAGLALVGFLIAVQRRASQADYRDTVDLQSKSHHGAI